MRRALAACAVTLLLALPAQGGLPPEHRCPTIGGAPTDEPGQRRRPAAPARGHGAQLRRRSSRCATLLPERDLVDTATSSSIEGCAWRSAPATAAIPYPSFFARRQRASSRAASRSTRRGTCAATSPASPSRPSPSTRRPRDAGVQVGLEPRRHRYRGAGPIGQLPPRRHPGARRQRPHLRGLLLLHPDAATAPTWRRATTRLPEVEGSDFGRRRPLRRAARRPSPGVEADASGRGPRDATPRADDTFVYVPDHAEDATGGDLLGRRRVHAPLSGRRRLRRRRPRARRRRVLGAGGRHQPHRRASRSHRRAHSPAASPTSRFARTPTSGGCAGSARSSPPSTAPAPGYPVRTEIKNFGPHGLSVADDRWDVRWAVVIEGGREAARPRTSTRSRSTSTTRRSIPLYIITKAPQRPAGRRRHPGSPLQRRHARLPAAGPAASGPASSTRWPRSSTTRRPADQRLAARVLRRAARRPPSARPPAPTSPRRTSCVRGRGSPPRAAEVRTALEASSAASARASSGRGVRDESMLSTPSS